MSMRSNQTEQMAKRLKQDLAKLNAGLTIEATGEATLTIKSGANIIAIAKMERRSFEGFNIVHELSSSVGQGFPEHVMWLAVKDDLAHATFAKISKPCFAAGCSEIKLVVRPAADTLDMTDLAEANVAAIIPNDARLGSVGA